MIARKCCTRIMKDLCHKTMPREGGSDSFAAVSDHGGAFRKNAFHCCQVRFVAYLGVIIICTTHEPELTINQTGANDRCNCHSNQNRNRIRDTWVFDSIERTQCPICQPGNRYLQSAQINHLKQLRQSPCESDIQHP